MLAFLLSPKTIVGFAIGALLVGAWSVLAHGPAQYDAGREAERAAARERVVELIEKRNRDNAEISDMDAAAICRELGGRWVQDNCVD